jgi:phosphatidylserine/phosphatidylglycerophosphate/cardiolipin synthase-like enzyme
LAYSPAHPQSLDVLGASTHIQLFIEPTSGHEPLLTAINRARSEVLVEVYLLSDKQILEALKQAHDRGVRVLVMLEEHPFGDGTINQKTAETLKKDGIDFQWTNPTYALTHEKSMVIDGKKAFILTQNLTTSAFSKNREYDVMDTSPEDVAEIRSIFTSDWNRQSFVPASTHLVISPNTSRAALTTLIKNAKKTIDIEIEDIADQQVELVLIDAAKTKRVRLLAPPLESLAGNSDALTNLSAGGVVVHVLAHPYLHAKLILIDESKAYVGSINLSSQSMDKNRELGIMLSERESVNMLEKTFLEDWEASKPLR